jgi:acyl-coenzyme A thioesterase PaaI-like protein
LALKFSSRADGSVFARFACAPRFQGYPDRLHGGVIAMLLDDAMVNCLLHEGIVGVTGRLNVGFREPVRLEKMAEIRAHVVFRSTSLYSVKAELYQGGCIMAQAEGKFMGEPRAIAPSE